jgi:tetratricopeptide (TPR) repeat protein
MFSRDAKHPTSFLPGAICCIVLSACSGQISTNSVPKDGVQLGDTTSGQLPSQQEMSQATYAVEAAISDGCLVAWRTATAGDYPGALKKLDVLQHKYPKSPTISFMKGQVLELSGNKKEAVKYYREGIRDNEYGGIQRFKLAEALRTTGDIKAAEKEYRRVIETSPEFVDARLGLAKVLRKKDPALAEVDLQLKEVLRIDPANKEALAMLKEARKSP